MGTAPNHTAKWNLTVSSAGFVRGYTKPNPTGQNKWNVVQISTYALPS